jgi:N-acyl-D-amino-acid deacylase
VEHFDLVVAGGRVLDGTGAGAREADVGIRDGRIVAIRPSLLSDAAPDTR